MIDTLAAAAFDARAATPYEAEVRRATERVLVDRLIALASTAPAAEVRAIAADRLDSLRARLETVNAPDERPMARLLAADIKRFLERPAEPAKAGPIPAAPPGAPIGDAGERWLPPYGTGTIWWDWYEQVDSRQ